MKPTCAKCIHVFLVLFILAAAMAPACAGSENCSMPCCRHKAPPVSHPTGAAHAKPCCTRTADASADIGSGCRFDRLNLALPSGADPGPSMAAAVGAEVFENPMRSCAAAPAARCADSSPPDIPLYLRLQALLI